MKTHSKILNLLAIAATLLILGILLPVVVCFGIGLITGELIKNKGKLSIGTKTLLYGAHCFLLHPWFVAWGWFKLYGMPWDARIWVSFFVHDLGYWGKPNLDGKEGKQHPVLGADIMFWLFDTPILLFTDAEGLEWYDFTLSHSREFGEPSKLCYADKLAMTLVPKWLYMDMVSATGEVWEYTTSRMGVMGKKTNYPLTNYTIKEHWYSFASKSLKKFAYTAPELAKTQNK